MKAIIMAGGGGTRLWPVSRTTTPKQGQPFGDNQTLLQKTFRRLRRGWSVDDIFVSTNVQHYPLLKTQLPLLPKAHFLLEPARRETAAAIGLVATILHKKNPREIMFTACSDHYVKEVDGFIDVIKAAGRVVQSHPDRTVLVGNAMQFADTGSGYIQVGKKAGHQGAHDYFTVRRFVEKPDQRTAEKFLASGHYLWNAGAFVFRVDAMLEKFRKYLPLSWKILMQIHDTVGTRKEVATIKKLFPKMQKISIDYGIMVHDRAMYALPAKLSWLDIGNWGTIYTMLADEPDHNIVRGLHVSHDSGGNLIYSFAAKEKVIATAGLRDMIVIDTEDALLICPKEKAQDVKHLVAMLEQNGLRKYL